MARLQILELPEGAGDDRPPFVLVVDQYQPLRYVRGMDQGEPEVVNEFEGVAEKIGASTVLVFAETVEILTPKTPTAPSGDAAYAGEGPNCADVPGCDGGCCEPRNIERELKATSKVIERLAAERDEARGWARHGYEIGQKHCSWSDHGVAPAWLTEGWPPHIDSCEHLKHAAEYDEALTRVRNLPEQPEIMDSQHEQPQGYLHGYRIAIRDAKRAAENGG